MADPRLELSPLVSAGSGGGILERLDSVRLVIESPAERCRDRADQAALYNLVNLAARLFPHIELRLRSIASQLGNLIEGDLSNGLVGLSRRVAPAPSREPDEVIHLAWAMQPTEPGFAGDASGWSYSVGRSHRPVAQLGGPVLGAIAATSLMVSQFFVERLSPLGLAGYVSDGFTANLLDYTHALAPSVPVDAGLKFGSLALLGCGSVGSSMLYAAVLAGLPGGPLDLVDGDEFKERNRLRYPILIDRALGAKPVWLHDYLEAFGIGSVIHETDIQGFLEAVDQPPAIGLAVVSVDTVTGRRDATDVLAKTTLNAGVDGLRLHVSRHGFGEDGCAYCQYVDARPQLSQAGVIGELVGLSVERVVAILEVEAGVISAADAQAMVASGRFVSVEPPAAGDRLADLQRRIYAQAAIATPEGEVLVSAPFVSAVAGVVLLGEVLKEADERLHSCRLSGRYDVDTSGEPPDFVQVVPRDATGRCLCWHPFRRRAYDVLHRASM